ncbi:MAG: hypothetical protein AB1611_06025 [bacterium]
MIRGKRCIILSVVILVCALMVCVSSGDAQLSGVTLSPLTGLRSDAFTQMIPALLPPLPYTPFAEGSSFFSFDPLSFPVLYDPLNFLLPLNSLSAVSPWPVIQVPYLTSIIPAASSLAPALSSSAGLPMRRAAQTGTWTGTWTSTYIAYIVLWHTGPMTLNIAVDPLTGTAVGTCILTGSKYANFLVNVSGVEANSVITLSGFLGTGYDLLINGVLTSPTTLTGYYTVTGTNIPVLDEGVFSLVLL